MAVPSTAITRYELSEPFSEFDLRVNQRGYIGPRIMRPRLVGLQSADVGKIELGQLLQQRDTSRAAASGYRRGEFEFTKYDYACSEHGWEEPMDDWTVSVYSDLIDAEATHSDRAVGFLCDAFERDVKDIVYDTNVWTGDDLTTALGNEWDDAAAATPIEDVFNAKEKVRLGSGLIANALVCNALQYFHLKNCDQVVERIKYVARADQMELSRAIADVLDIDMILVAGGLTNSANPQQAASISRVWPNENAMVCRVALTDDPREPCIGRTFIWTGDGPGSVGDDEKLAVVVEEYREEKVRGSVIRARNNRDLKVMYKQAGHLLSNVIAPPA